MIDQLLAVAYDANLPGLLAVAISATVGVVAHLWLSSESR